MHHSYKPARFHFTPHQLHKVRKGHKVRLAHHQIGKGPHTLFLHPVQHHKVSLAHAKGKGVDLIVSDGELGHTIDSGAEGTGFFGDLWDGVKKAGTWLKDSGVASAVADALQPVAATVIGPKGAELARKVLKGTTGVGLKQHHKKGQKKVVRKHIVEYETESEPEMHHKTHHKKTHRKVGNGLYL